MSFSKNEIVKKERRDKFSATIACLKRYEDEAGRYFPCKRKWINKRLQICIEINLLQNDEWSTHGFNYLPLLDFIEACVSISARFLAKEWIGTAINSGGWQLLLWAGGINYRGICISVRVYHMVNMGSCTPLSRFNCAFIIIFLVNAKFSEIYVRQVQFISLNFFTPFLPRFHFNCVYYTQYSAFFKLLLRTATTSCPRRPFSFIFLKPLTFPTCSSFFLNKSPV